MKNRERSWLTVACLLLVTSALLVFGGCLFQPVHEVHACFTADPTIGQAPLTVTFDASCSSADAVSPPALEDYFYIWDFDDENLGDLSGTVVEHTFTEPGTYLVQVAMMTTGPGGEPVAGATRPITVLPSG